MARSCGGFGSRRPSVLEVPYPPCPWPCPCFVGGRVASSSAGLPRTDCVCYMIAQLHDIVHLNHSRVQCCYSTCSHTDSKRPCRACHGGQRSLCASPLVMFRYTYIYVHTFMYSILVSPEFRPFANAMCSRTTRHLWNLATDHHKNHHQTRPFPTAVLTFGGASSLTFSNAGSRRPHRRNHFHD
jgi:hypothetical protein